MKFVWPESAKAQLRAIDRETAVRILKLLMEYGQSGAGDVRSLSGEWQGYLRIRIGDYRVIFSVSSAEITILRVGHRSEIYR